MRRTAAGTGSRWMESLTHEQLAYIERHGKSKNPKTIAKDLKLELRHVQHALKSLNDPKLLAPRTQTSVRFTTERLVGFAFVVAIVLLGSIAYSNNLSCLWHFDDNHAVLSN